MSIKQQVVDTLERFEETRRDRLEVVRRVLHANEKAAGVNPLQVDAAVNVLRAFRKVHVEVDNILRLQRQVQNEERPDLQDPVTAAKRRERAAEWRAYYSPKDDEPDENQISLF